jgi:choline-sulfatase
MVGEVDRRCARVLERARALPGPTIAIYLSDHGDLMGDHGLTAKTAFYEGSLGVPLIIAPVNAAGAAWLGARAGAVVDAPVSLLDLAPTLTGLAMTPEQRAADALVPASDSAWGANRPIALPGSDGRDLSPLLRDPSLAADPAWAERPVFSEMNVPFLPPARCVVRGRYKYVHYHGAGEQLFDLGDDPGEARNRAADLPELSTELRRLALQGWDAQRCLESRAARLRDCGYVTASAAAYPGAGDEVFLNRRV